MKIIPHNSKKYPDAKILVDDEDYEFVMKWAWAIRKDRCGTFYAVRGETKKGKKKGFSLHRQLMGVTDPKIKVDHIDHNGLNCQRYNLREATSAQNSMNRTKPKDRIYTSKYKGVHLNNGKWRACIRIVRKKLTHLGYFKTEIEAAIAYDNAALTAWGEYACLNFPKIKTPTILPVGVQLTMNIF